MAKSVDLAAKVAGQNARGESDEKGDGLGDHADGQADAAAVDDAGEDVSAVLVSTEDVGAAGVLEHVGNLLGVRVIGRQDGREDGHQAQQGNHDEAEHAELVLLEDVPGDSPVALGALLAGLGLLVGDGGGSVGRDALGLLDLGVVLVARKQSHYSAASSPSRMRGSTTA